MTTVVAVVNVAMPATAASRPVPSITKLSVSKDKAYVGDSVDFRVTVRNAGSRASAAAPVEMRLSDEGDVRGSVTITRGTLPSIPARARRTHSFAATIPASVPSDEYHVLVCRQISGKTNCQDKGKGELRVTRRSAQLTVEPSSPVNFGTVPEDSTSPARVITVRNVGQKPTGDVDLDVEGDDDEDFRITTNDCGASLAPGGACAVHVVFRPTDDGTLEAELDVDPDDGKGASVDLVGIGQEKDADDDGNNDGGNNEDDDDDEDNGSTTSPPATCAAGDTVGAAPASVLDLTNWKLTLPFDGCDGNEWADEITQPQLATFRDSRFFTVNPASGVVFRAGVDGARTSSNTKYPRSELREMTDGGEERASWSNESTSDGVHTMTMEAAITATPTNKPQVVAAQVHGGDDDVAMIRLYGKQLVVDADDSDVRLVLDEDYTLGERFTVSITASNGHIIVTYNGARTVDYQYSGDGMYFKAGCYTLSNTSYDKAGQYGEVVIYKLGVTHA